MRFKKYRLQKIRDRLRELKKKDAGTIFNPVLYVAMLLLAAQLLLIFVEYRRVAWVSGYVTNAMTDALLGACTLNEEELLSYGKTDDIEIRYPAEKYLIFKEILSEELGLTADMQAGNDSIPLLEGKVTVSDFRIYSVRQKAVTLYDFNENGGYTSRTMEQAKGVLTIENGAVIEDTAMVAEIAFTVNFLGFPMNVEKYHMVDVARN